MLSRSLPPADSARGAEPKRARVEQAWRQLLDALCQDEATLVGREGSWRAKSAQRAAGLWCERLLVGEGKDPSEPLRLAARAPKSGGAIVVSGLDVHLVCPHHLTVAFGQATIARVGRRRWAPFGAIDDMLSRVCGRLVMQEQATWDAASALVTGLGAKAAWVRLHAAHPCHRVSSPRAHQAEVVTEATAGERRMARALGRHATRLRQRPLRHRARGIATS